MSKSPITKTQQKALLNKVKSVLTARRNGKPKQETAALARLEAYCEKIGVDMGAAMEQGIAHLKRHSIAASMNGLV